MFGGNGLVFSVKDLGWLMFRGQEEMNLEWLEFRVVRA